MKDTLLQMVRRLVHHPRAERTGYAVSAVLLIVSLLLPPVSAGRRLFHLDYPAISGSGGAISASDGARLIIPAGALSRQLRLKISSVANLDFLAGAGDKAEDAAAAALKAKPVMLQSKVYRFLAYGPAPKEAVFTVPLPDNLASESVDAYAWDGKEWKWTRSQVIPEDKTVEMQLASIPSMVAVVQVKRSSPVVATTLASEVDLPGEATSLLTEINLAGFSVSPDGTVNDTFGASRVVPQGYVVIPIVDNLKDGQPQANVLNTVLLDAEARKKHVASLTSLTVEKMFGGVQLHYLGLAPELAEEFTSFVAELADSLHKQGKLLTVQVETPQQVSEDRWDTGAYDWQALGKEADALVVPAIETPSAFATDGQMEALLRWAVSQVERTKLQLALSVYGYQVIDAVTTRLPYLRALSELAQLAVEGDRQLVSPGEDVTLLLPKLQGSGGLCYDSTTEAYWFAYQNETGQQHKVWLESASSLAKELQVVLDYNLRGVTLRNLMDPQNDERMWAVLRYLKELTIPPLVSDFTVVWTIKGPSGEQVTSCSLLAPGHDGSAAGASTAGSAFVWQAPDSPGDYTIAALISDDGGQTTRAQSDSVELRIPSPTPTPTPTSTPTPTPTATPTSTPKPTPKPAPAAPAASRGPGFSYGIQGDALTDGDHGRLFGLIQQMGFKWYKQQVEWFRFNPGPGQYDWGALDRIVDSAGAAGIKLLFSVVKAPEWARPAGDTDQGPPADPNTYGEFLRAMATRYKGRVQGYEIWNEQNLYYEWGGLGNKLNARKYVELLKVAYQAVKTADPAATVISGALTPTGYNDGNIAIDDRVYLEQMYQAGLKNYCDAVGAHPSGYNNPPDAKWETYSDLTSSFNARGHPSWFFRGTLESYRNIMLKYGDGSKRVWVTEFGWASVENLGSPPARGYEYAADNTEAEQAQYITGAYALAKSWGWVGPMFLWNLNFGPICGGADEKSAFGIVRPDWGMRPAFAGLANMPK